MGRRRATRVKAVTRTAVEETLPTLLLLREWLALATKAKAICEAKAAITAIGISLEEDEEEEVVDKHIITEEEEEEAGEEKEE